MLSIIIPTHNRLMMLKELLKSIMKQSYADIEVIIILDACSDGTYDFLKHAKLPIKWRYIVNELPLNAGGSRKRGFMESKGKFVTFIDDDDYLTDSHFYEYAIKIFEKYPNLSVLAANSIDMYEDNSCVETQTNINGYINGMEYLSGFQHKWYKPHPSFAIFNKLKLEKAGIKNMYMVNDTPLYLRALLEGDIYIENNPVGIYRIHASNISKSISSSFIIANLKEKCYIYKELKKRKVNFDLSMWWYKMVRETFDYFMVTNPSDTEIAKVKYWCLAHMNNSMRLGLYLTIISPYCRFRKKFQNK